MSERCRDLVDRLRGKYTIPVNDGAGLLDGKDTFTQEFAVTPISREAADEIERLRRYRDVMEHCHGNRIYAVEKLLDHFDEEGNLKGDGKWRIGEIYRCVKDMDEASAEAARLFNNPDEPVPKETDEAAAFAKQRLKR